MSANSAARAARFIFRPSSAASAGGVCGRTALAHRSPNAALAVSAGGVRGWTGLSRRSPNAALAAATNRRHMSEFILTRRAFLVDTLALVRGMEAQGIQSKHAEAITSAITKVLENVAESFVSKEEMQKSEMIRDANLSKFKSEVQSSRVLHLETPDVNLSKFEFKSEVQRSQEHHFSLLQQSTEKFRGDIDLLYWRLRKQIAETADRTTKQIEEITDRTTKQIEETTDRFSKQIVETTDRFSKQIVEFTDRMTKVDREVNALRAQLPVEFHGLRAQIEAAKYDVIKYCIGTVVPITAVTLAVLCIGL